MVVRKKSVGVVSMPDVVARRRRQFLLFVMSSVLFKASPVHARSIYGIGRAKSSLGSRKHVPDLLHELPEHALVARHVPKIR